MTNSKTKEKLLVYEDHELETSWGHIMRLCLKRMGGVKTERQIFETGMVTFCKVVRAEVKQKHIC